jgi:hypothetical protein
VATTSIVISIRGGSTDRPEVELLSGTPVEAFSVGTEGGWRVTGGGVGGVHAYLYFDGGTLFVAAAPGAIVRSGRATVSTDWMPLSVPSEVNLGEVTLEIRSGAEMRAPAATKPATPKAPQVQKPQPSARPAPKPVRPPSEVVPGGKPALTAGTSDYDDSDAPTQYQPAPAGFLDAPAPPSLSPDSATQIHHGHQVAPDVEPVGEDATHVMQDETRTNTAPRPAAGQRPQPGSQAYSPPRPMPPSDRGAASGDGATVVRPLEEFLAQAGAAGAEGLPDTSKHPLVAPDVANAAMGVIISPPDPTRPPSDGLRWVGDPASPDARLVPAQGTPVMQGYPPMGQQPGMPQGGPPWIPQPGMQQPGMPSPGMPPGMQPGMGAPGQQQQWPGQPAAWGGQQYPDPAQGWAGTQGQAQAQAADPVAKALATWKAMPIPRKIMLIMLPFGLIAFLVVFASPQPKAGSAGTKPKSSASGSTSAAPPPTLATQTIPSVAKTTPPPPSGAETAAPPPSTATPPTTAPPTASATEEPPPEAPKLSKGEVTLARKASDAVAVNDYAKALEAYQQLAKEHPENPAYAQAVQILRRKLAKK